MQSCSDANDTHTLAVGLMDDGAQLAVALTLKGASSGGTPITITLHMYTGGQAGRQGRMTCVLQLMDCKEEHCWIGSETISINERF